MLKYFKCLSLGISLFFLCNNTVKAQKISNLESNNIFSGIQFVPPQDGETPDTKGAGTRNPEQLKCSADDSAIEAIMPDNNYGLTTKEHPKIFFYLPNTTAKQVVLSFQDREKKYHEVSFFPIDTNSNIVSFALTKDKPPLEDNTYYQWTLTLVCGDIPHVNDPIFTGWIKRANVDNLAKELEQKTVLEQAQWYGQNGYWYDLLEHIANIEKYSLSKQSDYDSWRRLVEQY